MFGRIAPKVLGMVQKSQLIDRHLFEGKALTFRLLAKVTRISRVDFVTPFDPLKEVRPDWKKRVRFTKNRQSLAKVP